MTDPLDLTLRQVRIHRVHRRGVFPLLEVTVTYPVLLGATDDLPPTACRFNHAYALMAENWIVWTETALLEETTAGFDALGAAAAYGFVRRRASLTMEATLSCGVEASLTVTRTVRLEGGGAPPSELSDRDAWQWPGLTLSPSSLLGTRGKNREKKRKNMVIFP